jgi:uncharacterized membrane protein YfhO
VLKTLSDVDGNIELAVNAQRAGYVVIADSLQQVGWHATLDARPTKLVAADAALVALYVPAGRHIVRVHYLAPGQRTGLVISSVALVVLSIVSFEPWLRGRWRRTKTGPYGGEDEVTHDNGDASGNDDT